MITGLMTKEDNEVFAHYIFMDNEFFLPTATGVPLRIALSGTFTPGVKGGMALNGPDMVISNIIQLFGESTFSQIFFSISALFA